MFFNTAHFEFTKLFEHNWLTIRGELERLQADQFTPWPLKQLYNKDWRTFALFGGIELGKKEVDTRNKATRTIQAAAIAKLEEVYTPELLEKNRALCPETTKILEAIPGMVTAGFSRLTPGTHIKPHRGYSSDVLRYHLGLIVPEGCGIMVRGQTRKWVEGKSLIFEDTNLHEAWNFGNSQRIVLIVDFNKNTVKGDLNQYIEPMTWKEVVAAGTQYARFTYDNLTKKARGAIRKLKSLSSH
jgi:beta-hydroxylase